MLYWDVLDRYLDGEFLFGVDGESVYRLTGAMIPQVRLGWVRLAWLRLFKVRVTVRLG